MASFVDNFKNSVADFLNFVKKRPFLTLGVIAVIVTASVFSGGIPIWAALIAVGGGFILDKISHIFFSKQKENLKEDIPYESEEYIEGAGIESDYSSIQSALGAASVLREEQNIDINPDHGTALFRKKTLAPDEIEKKAEDKSFTSSL